MDRYIPVVWLDTEDDDDPYYCYQEEMSHLAETHRIGYGQWIKRELGRLRELEHDAAVSKAFDHVVEQHGDALEQLKDM